MSRVRRTQLDAVQGAYPDVKAILPALIMDAGVYFDAPEGVVLGWHHAVNLPRVVARDGVDSLLSLIMNRSRVYAGRPMVTDNATFHRFLAFHGVKTYREVDSRWNLRWVDRLPDDVYDQLDSILRMGVVRPCSLFPHNVDPEHARGFLARCFPTSPFTTLVSAFEETPLAVIASLFLHRNLFRPIVCAYLGLSSSFTGEHSLQDALATGGSTPVTSSPFIAAHLPGREELLTEMVRSGPTFFEAWKTYVHLTSLQVEMVAIMVGSTRLTPQEFLFRRPWCHPMWPVITTFCPNDLTPYIVRYEMMIPHHVPLLRYVVTCLPTLDYDLIGRPITDMCLLHQLRVHFAYDTHSELVNLRRHAGRLFCIPVSDENTGSSFVVALVGEAPMTLPHLYRLQTESRPVWTDHQVRSLVRLLRAGMSVRRNLSRVSAYERAVYSRFSGEDERFSLKILEGLFPPMWSPSLDDERCPSQRKLLP